MKYHFGRSKAGLAYRRDTGEARLAWKRTALEAAVREGRGTAMVETQIGVSRALMVETQIAVSRALTVGAEIGVNRVLMEAVKTRAMRSVNSGKGSLPELAARERGPDSPVVHAAAMHRAPTPSSPARGGPSLPTLGGRRINCNEAADRDCKSQHDQRHGRALQRPCFATKQMHE